MRPASFAQAGVGEDLKALVHGATCVCVGLMAGYNLVAWLHRRERHLAVNAVLYSALAVWEGQQIGHHLAAWKGASPYPQGAD